MIKSNHFFTGGVGHGVCEDYALSGSFSWGGDKYHYGIVSDGCTQAEDTDIGCRLISLAAKESLDRPYLRDLFESQGQIQEVFSELGKNILDRTEEFCDYLGLSLEALSATLLIVIQKEGCPKVYTVAFGDGFVFGIKDRKVFIKRISYQNEAPYYMRYDLSPGVRDIYVNKFGGEKNIESWTFDLDSAMNCNTDRISESHDVSKPFVFEFNDFDYVGIASDGFDSISEIIDNGVRNPLTSEHVFRDALNIKNFNGEFVNRHLAFLTKRRWKNRELFDDLSIAMIANVEEK